MDYDFRDGQQPFELETPPKGSVNTIHTDSTDDAHDEHPIWIHEPTFTVFVNDQGTHHTDFIHLCMKIMNDPSWNSYIGCDWLPGRKFYIYATHLSTKQYKRIAEILHKNFDGSLPIFADTEKNETGELDPEGNPAERDDDDKYWCEECGDYHYSKVTSLTKLAGKVVECDDFYGWDHQEERDCCFGWVDGTLYLGDTHHARIIAGLIESNKYDWDSLITAKQMWGWVTYYPAERDDEYGFYRGRNWRKTKNAYAEVRFATDDAKQTYGIKAKVLADIGAYFGCKTFADKGTGSTTQDNYGGRARRNYLPGDDYGKSLFQVGDKVQFPFYDYSTHKVQNTVGIVESAEWDKYEEMWIYAIRINDGPLTHEYEHDLKKIAQFKGFEGEKPYTKLTYGELEPAAVLANGCKVYVEDGHDQRGRNSIGGCFGFVNGDLYLGDHHHALIVFKLIESGKYDWNSLENAKQKWGWYHSTQGHLDVSFTSDEAKQTKGYGDECAQAFSEFYDMPVKISGGEGYTNATTYGERSRAQYFGTGAYCEDCNAYYNLDDEAAVAEHEHQVECPYCGEYYNEYRYGEESYHTPDNYCDLHEEYYPECMAQNHIHCDEELERQREEEEREEEEMDNHTAALTNLPNEFEFTGEYRAPKEGEWFYDRDRINGPVEARFDYIMPKQILRYKNPLIAGKIAPAGYTFTGEFRIPQKGEPYLGNDNRVWEAISGGSISYPILRSLNDWSSSSEYEGVDAWLERKDKEDKEKAQQVTPTTPTTTVNTWMPRKDRYPKGSEEWNLVDILSDYHADEWRWSYDPEDGTGLHIWELPAKGSDHGLSHWDQHGMIGYRFHSQGRVYRADDGRVMILAWQQNHPEAIEAVQEWCKEHLGKYADFVHYAYGDREDYEQRMRRYDYPVIDTWDLPLDQKDVEDHLDYYWDPATKSREQAEQEEKLWEQKTKPKKQKSYNSLPSVVPKATKDPELIKDSIQTPDALIKGDHIYDLNGNEFIVDEETKNGVKIKSATGTVTIFYVKENWPVGKYSFNPQWGQKNVQKPQEKNQEGKFTQSWEPITTIDDLNDGTILYDKDGLGYKVTINHQSDPLYPIGIRRLNGDGPTYVYNEDNWDSDKWSNKTPYYYYNVDPTRDRAKAEYNKKRNYPAKKKKKRNRGRRQGKPGRRW